MRFDVPAAAASGPSFSGSPCSSAWSVHASRSRCLICGWRCLPIARCFHVTIGTSIVPVSRSTHHEEIVMRVVFVHGACVKDGSWWWHPTGELLAERGVAGEAPALPSCGETGQLTDGGGPGLAEDVAAVRQVLTASDEPTVVVAHSYGGIVTAEAAAGVEAVRHLLLVSSYLPEVGQSLSSFGREEPAPYIDIDPEGGTFTVRPDTLAGTFLQDCDPEIQREAAEKTA